jgi:hypothetical protein
MSNDRVGGVDDPPAETIHLEEEMLLLVRYQAGCPSAERRGKASELSRQNASDGHVAAVGIAWIAQGPRILSEIDAAEIPLEGRG